MSSISILKFFAILAGTIPNPNAHPHPGYHAPPAIHHHIARHHHKAAPTHVVRLPVARPYVASLPPAPAVETPVVRSGSDQFVWKGRYALPPKWVQIWAYIG